ncbi:unnamed protein product [Amoebophrya sp. A25]|nr:unnamed protein product [Amoebophrya sp. A25]|eukprot:GSA25T00010604001.1
MRKRLSGLGGVGPSVRGQLLMACVRSTMSFGQQARATLPTEVRELAEVEALMAAKLSRHPLWRYHRGEVRRSEILKEMRIPPLSAFFKYIKVKHWGHVLRAESSSLERSAILGQFFPEQSAISPGREAYLRTIADEKDVPPSERLVYSLQDQVARHLTRECGLSPAMIESLLQPCQQEEEEAQQEELSESEQKGHEAKELERYAERKQFYYLATRAAFIYSTVEEWTSHGSAQWEKEQLWGEMLCKHLEGKSRSTAAAAQKVEHVEKLQVWQNNEQGVADASLHKKTIEATFVLTGGASATLESLQGGEQHSAAIPGVVINPQCFESGEVAIIHTKQGNEKQRGTAIVSFSGPVWLHQVRAFKQGSTAMKFKHVGTVEEGWEAYTGDAFTCGGFCSEIKSLRKMVLPGEKGTLLEFARDSPLYMVTAASSISTKAIRIRKMPHAAGNCPSCDWRWTKNFSQNEWDLSSPEVRADALMAHFEHEHPVAEPKVEPLAQALRKVAKQDAQGDYALKKQKQRRGSGVCFWRLKSAGPKLKTRKKHPERYECRICDMRFATSYGSMKQHEQAHQANEPTKSYKVVIKSTPTRAAVGSVQNLYRPEQHAIHPTTGKYYPGPGVKLHKLYIPTILRCKERTKKCLRCHKCEKWKVEFDEEVMTMLARSKRIDLLKRHMRKCKKK